DCATPRTPSERNQNVMELLRMLPPDSGTRAPEIAIDFQGRPQRRQEEAHMKRGLGLIALASLMATGIVADRADAATPITFNVTIGSPLSYRFNGDANDQVLELMPGKTYQFLMSAADTAAHPFFIATTTRVEPPTPFVD